MIGVSKLKYLSDWKAQREINADQIKVNDNTLQCITSLLNTVRVLQARVEELEKKQ